MSTALAAGGEGEGEYEGERCSGWLTFCFLRWHSLQDRRLRAALEALPSIIAQAMMACLCQEKK